MILGAGDALTEHPMQYSTHCICWTEFGTLVMNFIVIYLPVLSPPQNRKADNGGKKVDFFSLLNLIRILFCNWVALGLWAPYVKWDGASDKVSED